MQGSLINMETTPAEAKEYTEPTVADAPKYPWGLCLTLNDDSLDKLGVKALPPVDTEVTIIAKAVVSRTSEDQTLGDGARACMDLQITDMQLQLPETDLLGRAADLLYGKK